MKQPSDLTRAELEEVVLVIRDILWRDPISGELDPERSWNSETIEWVSGALEDAGLKPEPILPASPGIEDNAEAPAARMRSALQAFIDTIEATGGCIRPGNDEDQSPGEGGPDFDLERLVPAGDEQWGDLADAYVLACRALDRQPMIRAANADDGEELDDP